MTDHPADSDLQALLDTLFESVPVGMAFIDRQFRYVRVNQRLAEMNGRTVDEHLGRTVMEVRPNLGTTLFQTYVRVLETGEAVIEQELIGEHANAPGKRSLYVASHYPVRQRTGTIVGIGVIVQDVTEERAARAEAEAERQKLRTLFMQAPAAIALLRGPEHIYELSNPANNAGLGKDPTGQRVRDAFPEIAAQGYGELLDRVYQNSERFADPEALLKLQTPDGQTRDVFVNGFYEPMRGADGKVEGVMVFGFEVTEQVLARRRAEQAEQEAQTAVHVRDEFMSIAGHELRTPLTALQLHLQNLQFALSKHSNPELLARFEKAVVQSRRLERLISELLDVSRIGAGRLELRREDTDLAELAAEVVERFADVAAQNDAPLVLSAPQPVRGRWDRSRIDQVITNLLSNAIKYGPGHPIEIEVLLQHGMARLRVVDHGIGIDPEAQPRVFERFERAVAEHHYGGLGVGLWLSREIVHAHGGRIKLESEKHHGTTVEVELPLESSR